MSLRKQPIGFFYNKLKVVFVFFVLLALVFNVHDIFPPSPISSQWHVQNSQYWSAYLDSMLIKVSSKESPLHPFNPNYLTDYRAYRLGLPLSVVDAIKDHRSQNRWINTVTEFQQLTQISDSTLLRIRPFLTFPKAYAKKRAKPLPIKKIDINQATQNDLEALYGIGPVLAQRILRYRERIQAFSDMKQLGEVYGLSASVINQLNQRFSVTDSVTITKIPFAYASLSELSALPYLSYEEARWLVLQRTKSPDDPLDSLMAQANWPTDKVQRIKLYLY